LALCKIYNSIILKDITALEAPALFCILFILRYIPALQSFSFFEHFPLMLFIPFNFPDF